MLNGQELGVINSLIKKNSNAQGSLTPEQVQSVSKIPLIEVKVNTIAASYASQEYVNTELSKIELQEGKSAYEVAKANGFIGTEQQWLASLKGATGAKGEKGDKGDTGTVDTSNFYTKSEVDTKIAEAQLSGGEVDLSSYATKEELTLHRNEFIVELDKKVDKTSVYTKGEIDAKLSVIEGEIANILIRLNALENGSAPSNENLKRQVAYVVKPWEDGYGALTGLDMFKDYNYGSALLCLPLDNSYENNTPFCDVTESLLDQVVAKCETMGLDVTLKLHNIGSLEDGTGNSNTPTNPTTWFANYMQPVQWICSMAKKYGHDKVIISNEMAHVMNKAEWKSLFLPCINYVKSQGLKCGMSANLPEIIDGDGYQFYDEMDFFTINAYPQLTKNSIEWAENNHEALKNAFYQEMQGGWYDADYGTLIANLGGANNLHKEVWITEIGCIPTETGLHAPAYWGSDLPKDRYDVQRIYLDAMFDVLENDQEAGKLSKRLTKYTLWDGNSDSYYNPVGHESEIALKVHWNGEERPDTPEPPVPPEEEKITIISGTYYAKPSDTSIEIVGTTNVTGVNNYEALSDDDNWGGVATFVDGKFILDLSWITWEETKNNLKMVAFDGAGNIIAKSEETFNLIVSNTEPPTNVPVTSVSINKTAHTFTNTDSLQLTATVEPSNASNKAVTWTTTNIAVATVSPNGLVRPVGNGSCQITVKTVDGNFTKACNINVDIEEVPAEGINYFDINNTQVELYRSSYVVDKTNKKVTVTSVNEGGIDGYVKWSLPRLQEGRTYRLTCTTNNTRNFIRIKANGSTVVTQDQKTAYDYTFVGKDGATNLIDLEMGIRHRGDTSTTPINIEFMDITIVDVNGDPDIPDTEGGLTFTVEDYKIVITDGTRTEKYDACCDIPVGDYVKGYRTVIKDRVAYYLPLATSSSSGFIINGLKPINHGYIDEAYKARFSNRAYGIVQNTLVYPLRNDPVTPVNEDALMEAIRIFNCAIPEMKIVIDETSNNVVSEDYFTEEFFGVCRLYSGEKFRVDMNTRFFGEQANNSQFIKVLVHEFGHITGIWDDSPHFPSMYSYDRDWSKTLYLQPSDIMHIRDKYSHLITSSPVGGTPAEPTETEIPLQWERNGLVWDGSNSTEDYCYRTQYIDVNPTNEYVLTLPANTTYVHYVCYDASNKLVGEGQHIVVDSQTVVETETDFKLTMVAGSSKMRLQICHSTWTASGTASIINSVKLVELSPNNGGTGGAGGDDNNSDNEIHLEEITVSNSLWAKSGSIVANSQNITDTNLSCIALANNAGLSTPTLSDLIPKVAGKTLLVTGEVTTPNTTFYVKMRTASGWTFGRLNSSKTLIEVKVPADLTDFKLALESDIDGEVPLNINNYKVFISEELVLNSYNDIPNRNYAVWSWSSSQVTSPEETATFLNKFKVKTIYQYFATSLTTAQISNFVRTMKQSGIKVQWLVGQPTWSLAINQSALIAEIQKVASYNSSVKETERVYTIQFDIEPHTLDEFDTNRDWVVEQYQQAVLVAVEECNKHGIYAVMTLAHWYDGVEYNNSFGSGTLFEFVSDNSNGTAIMAYTPAGYLSASTKEVSYCSRNNKSVSIGFETKEVDDQYGVTADITYSGRPVSLMYSDFERVLLLYNTYGISDRHEFAIHDYRAFHTYVAELSNKEVIVLDKEALELTLGNSAKLTATLPTTLQGKTVTWESMDNSKVVVDAEGNVLAISFGQAKVRATVDGIYAECTVTVNDVTVSKPANTVYVKSSGSDASGTGSSSSPYRTINKALSVIDPKTTSITLSDTYYDLSAVTATGVYFYAEKGKLVEVSVNQGSTFTNCVFDNVSLLFNSMSSTFNFTDCTFQNNSYSALFAKKSGIALNLTRCRIKDVSPNEQEWIDNLDWVRFWRFNPINVYGANIRLTIKDSVFSNIMSRAIIYVVENMSNGTYTINNTIFTRCEGHVVCFESPAKGDISNNYFTYVGALRNTIGNTDEGHGVGGNCVFGNSDLATYSDMTVNHNHIVFAMENGIEGNFKEVAYNYIRETGYRLSEGYYNPSTEGIWGGATLGVHHNTIINPKMSGIRLENYGRAGITSLQCVDNTIVYNLPEYGEEGSNQSGVSVVIKQVEDKSVTVRRNSIEGFPRVTRIDNGGFSETGFDIQTSSETPLNI